MSAGSNVASVLARRSSSRGWDDETLMWEASSGERLTHGAAHRRSSRIASALVERGVSEGDLVGLALPDGPAWLLLFLALARLGAVAVLLNPELPGHLLIRAVRQTQTKHVVGFLRDICVPDSAANMIDADEAIARADHAPEREAAEAGPRSPLYAQFSSGTTGGPKAVLHTHGDFQHFAVVGDEAIGFGQKDVGLSISRCYFAYGFANTVVYPLSLGGAAVARPYRPKPEQVLDDVERFAVTVLYTVPSALAAWSEASAARGAPVGRALRTIVSAGEPLPSKTRERAAVFGEVPIIEQLGCTEVGNAFCADRTASPRPGSVGPAVPGYEVQLVPPGACPSEGRQSEEEGELWVRGATIASHAIAAYGESVPLLRDGWLRTGDIARRNADGTWTCRGRSDEAQLVGGITVIPFDVEQVIERHPDVRRSVVLAVPDRTGATKLRAVVLSARNDRALEDEVLRLARASLAPYQVPRSVRAVADIPRNTNGKVVRRDLAALFHESG